MYEEHQRRMRGNNLRREGDEGTGAVRAGLGLLTRLLRCGRCGRKLHVRYWGKHGTAARYLCLGDFPQGGRYCLGFGGSTVDRRIAEEVLRVLSPLGVQASLEALEQLAGQGQRAPGRDAVASSSRRSTRPSGRSSSTTPWMPATAWWPRSWSGDGTRRWRRCERLRATLTELERRPSPC